PTHDSSAIVRVTSLTRLEGYRLEDFYGGWSPSAPLLLLTRPPRSGYFVWDASHPDRAPRQVLARSHVLMASWSPAGDRVLFVIRDPTDEQKSFLLAANANGSETDTLLRKTDCWPVSWASDASIYYRTGQKPHRIQAPAHWHVAPEILARKTPILMTGRGAGPAVLSPLSQDEIAISKLNRRKEGRP